MSRDQESCAVKKTDFKALCRISASLAALIGCVFCHSATAAAQQHPDLDGVWKRVPAISKLVPVAGGEVPFSKQGQADYQENRESAAKGDFGFDQTMATCSSPGLPRLMVIPERFRIFQRERVVTMMFEWNRQFRQIDMRGGPQERPPADSMIGVSYGHWEGDALVVKSLGFLPGKLLDSELPSSESLELLERIRLKDHDTLEDLITITDPVNFTRPWQATLTYKRQADEQFPEDLCLDRKKAGQPVLPG
jgi:hypothetical protein